MHAFDRVTDYMEPDERDDEWDIWDQVDEAYDRWKEEETEWDN